MPQFPGDEDLARVGPCDASSAAPATTSPRCGSSCPAPASSPASSSATCDLDGAGFSERARSAAWHQKTNQEVASSILGFIRQQALGDPLVPYGERVDRAVARLLGSRAWTGPQRDSLRKIALQLCQEVIVDREALDSGQFKAQGGGFQGIDLLFQGQLAEVLAELQERIWDVAP